MALNCTYIDNNNIWMYESDIKCYTIWQWAYWLFFIMYVLPFNFIFYTGTKLLKTKQISGKAFLIGWMVPLIMIFNWDCWPRIKADKR